MGIREKLNENPAITTGATIGIILIALIFIGYQLFNSGPASQIQKTAYYTTDDSSPEGALAALFADDVKKVPPFQKDGKEAYLAHVFSCDGGKNKWVAYVQRFTPEAKAKIEAAQKAPDAAVPPMMEEVYMTGGLEVKKPGAGKWVKNESRQESAAITEIKCPDGTLDNIEAVHPD